MADKNKKYGSDRKSYKVSFKLSEKDKHILEEAAKKAGMNVSEYLRNLVRSGGQVDATFVKDRSALIRQITGMCTNVNQIAKRANEQQYVYISDVIKMCDHQEEIKKLMQEVITVWQLQKYCT